MCGIAGYLTEKPVAKLDAALRGMAAAIVQRGPDDEGQPMCNEDGPVHIVFNGEIHYSRVCVMAQLFTLKWPTDA
jgi:asparagine synthetase B (glutamine-hydrolysing)